jgi:hypothetical protein
MPLKIGVRVRFRWELYSYVIKFAGERVIKVIIGRYDFEALLSGELIALSLDRTYHLGL